MKTDRYGIDVHIPQSLTEALKLLAEARGLPLDKYIQEKLWFVVEINKIQDPTA